jgi:hypothetical protein
MQYSAIESHLNLLVELLFDLFLNFLMYKYLFFVDENIESMKCSCGSTTPGTGTGTGNGLANEFVDLLGFSTTPEQTKSIFSLLGWSTASSATSRLPHQLPYFVSCLLLFVYPGHAVM